MAKKKTTENIKAAPVLRSNSGGEQPSTPTITKSYGIRDDWKDKSISNYVAFKSVDGEIQDLTVNGEPAGGGGGGTATIIITNSSNSAIFEITTPYISSETGYAYANGTSINAGETRTITVPLGPSGCFGYFGGKGDFPESGTATGGITYDDGDIYITGNGTLTVA